MRGWVLLGAMAITTTAGAADSGLAALLEERVQAMAREWSGYEAVRDATKRPTADPRLGRFESYGMQLMLAPDGGYAVAWGEVDGADPASVMIGHWKRDGNWLELELTAVAANPGAMTAADAEQAAAAFEAAIASGELDAEQALDEIEHWMDPGSLLASMSGHLPSRLLPVPYRGGHLLIPEEHVARQASRWDGKGPLELQPFAWRVPGLEPRDDHVPHDFSIENPLRADLPIELTALLRPGIIETAVAERIEPEAGLAWKAHKATVRLQLDKGGRDGLYPNMTLFGLPPDEHLLARVAEVTPEGAIAEFEVERFSPEDQPQLPGPGVRFVTRREQPMACGIPTGVAVRAQVLAGIDADELEYDADGFAFAQIEIDRGARHGLMVGDAFTAEEYSFDGQGRVRSTDSVRSVVQWRIQRYGEFHEPTPPQAGTALVTPAWRRLSYDSFGAQPQHEAEPALED